MFSTPDRCPYLPIPHEITFRVGRLATPATEQFGEFRLAAPGMLEDAYRTAGFREIAVHKVPTRMRFPSLGEAIQYASGPLPLRELMARLGHTELEQGPTPLSSRPRDASAGLPIVILPTGPSAKSTAEIPRPTLIMRRASPEIRTDAARGDRVELRLLADDDRELFERRSVFAGGWKLVAVQAVCNSQAVLAGPARLVDQSLVAAERPGSGSMRYRMLEPVRQFPRERLERRGAVAEVALARDWLFSGHVTQARVWLDELLTLPSR